MIKSRKTLNNLILGIIVTVMASPTPNQADVVFSTRPDRLQFLFVDRAYKLPFETNEIIEAIADFLKSNPNEKITISGAGGASGGSEINLLFGSIRAEGIRHALAQKGVRDSQMEAISLGDQSRDKNADDFVMLYGSISMIENISKKFPRQDYSFKSQPNQNTLSDLSRDTVDENIRWVHKSTQFEKNKSNVPARIKLQQALDNELRKEYSQHREIPKDFSARKKRLEGEKPTKDEFESSLQFTKRVERWNFAVEELNSDIKKHYENLGPLPLDIRAKVFERALSQAYGNPHLIDIRYDPESERFFATLQASLDSQFKRILSIPVPNDQARAAKSQLESDRNGLEIGLRVTEKNELIWGQPRVRIDNKVVIAQFVDKDFVPPSISTLAADSQLKTIVVPIIAPLPQTANVKIIEDPSLNKLQMEVLQKEREQAALVARQAEEKRLKDRLSELNRQSQTNFNDDLPGLIAKLPATKPNPRLHVLAIGINDYADVPDVPFADRSAQQFAEISQKLLGAQPQNVIVLTDGQATLGRMLSRLNTLLNRLGPQDQLLFYYAGHGVPSKDGTGAYLLAQDGGPGSYEQPDLKLGQIYSAIAKSRVGQATVFIDACFSGRSGKDSIVFEGIAPIVVKQKQSSPNSDRIAVMTAGRGDQFSNQDKGRGHRMFSYHLMRLILEDGTKLEIGQLHQRLRQRVLEDSRRIGPEFEQEPELQGNGRLVFVN